MQILLPEMPDDNDGDIVEEDEAQLGMHSMRNENITYLYRFAIRNSYYALPCDFVSGWLMGYHWILMRHDARRCLAFREP